MKKVIIITDSIAMPRPEVRYEDTWIYMIKDEFPDYDIMDRSTRGATSMRLVTEGGGGVDLLETYKPHIVILQLGLAECAPRLFKKNGFEYYCLTKILRGKLRTKYINLIKKSRGRNPDITDVTPDQFKNNIINYFDRAKRIGARIIAISIIKPSDLFKQKSPHIEKNINLYNKIYDEASELFNNVEILTPFDNSFDINKISIDELHISTRGQKIIFNKLKSRLK